MLNKIALSLNFYFAGKPFSLTLESNFSIISAKLQNTPPLICISLNKNSIYFCIPQSSKHTDTGNGWAGVFCNRSVISYFRQSLKENMRGR